MSAQGTANVAVKKKSVKSALVHGTFAVFVATSGVAFIHPYSVNPGVIKDQENDNKHKGVYSTGFLKKQNFGEPKNKSFAKPTILEFSTFKGGEDMSYIEPVSASSIVQFPTVYKGKLTPAPENDFTLNNDREVVDISQKVEKVSVSTTYKGRLPVGRERM